MIGLDPDLHGGFLSAAFHSSPKYRAKAKAISADFKH